MGLNYKSAPITTVEPYMPSINKEQMGQEIAITEKLVNWENQQTQNNLNQLQALRQGIGNIRVFPEFAEDVNKSLQGYTDEINKITEVLNKDPKQFARMGGQLQSIAANFTNDFTTGKYANYTKGYNDFITSYTKDRQNDKLDPYLVGTAYKKAQEEYIKQLQENPNTPFLAPNIPEVPDMTDMFNDVSKIAPPESVYDPETGIKYEHVDPDKLQGAKDLVMGKYASQLQQLKETSPEYYNHIIGNLENMMNTYGKSNVIKDQKSIAGESSSGKGKSVAGEQASLTYSDLNKERKIISPYTEVKNLESEISKLQTIYDRTLKDNNTGDPEIYNRINYLKSELENRKVFHKTATDEAYKAMGQDAERLKMYEAKANEESGDLVDYQERLKKMANSLPDFTGATKDNSVSDRLKKHNQLKASYNELTSLMTKWQSNYRKIYSEMQNDGKRIGNPEVNIINTDKLNDIAITSALQSGFEIDGRKVEGGNIDQEEIENLTISKISFDNNKINMYVTGNIEGKPYKNSKIIIDNPDSIQQIGNSLSSNKTSSVATFGKMISNPSVRSLYAQIQNIPNGRIDKKLNVSSPGPSQTITYGNVKATVKKVMINGQSKFIFQSFKQNGVNVPVNTKTFELPNGKKIDEYLTPEELQNLIINLNMQ